MLAIIGELLPERVCGKALPSRPQIAWGILGIFSYRLVLFYNANNRSFRGFLEAVEHLRLGTRSGAGIGRLVQMRIIWLVMLGTKCRIAEQAVWGDDF
jgi:hypothetical protein